MASQREKDWYVYQVPVASIAPGASAIVNISIRAYADFVIHKLSYFADIAGAAQTDSSRVLPLVNLQITDTGSGRQFFSDVVPIPALFGYGGLPYILPGPRVVDASSTLSFAFTNYDAAATYRIYLALTGVEVQHQ